MMKSYIPKVDEIERKWYVIDAEDLVVGRLASEIVRILTGKNKAIYTPHLDTGDHVIVINADKVRLTGKKLEDGEFVYHTGHPGGIKRVSYKQMMEETPERFIQLAVKGMLTKNNNTAEYLNSHLFKYGKSIEENDLIKQFTGKPLSASDFCANLK